MFVLQPEPTLIQLQDVKCTPMELESRTSMFDISFEISEMSKGAGLKGQIEFSTALFSLDTITRMKDHFLTLLAGKHLLLLSFFF